MQPVPPAEPTPSSSTGVHPEEASRPDSLTIEIQQASPNRRARVIKFLRGEADEALEEKDDRLSVSPSPSPKSNKRKFGDDDPDSEDEPIPGEGHCINYCHYDNSSHYHYNIQGRPMSRNRPPHPKSLVGPHLPPGGGSPGLA